MTLRWHGPRVIGIERADSWYEWAGNGEGRPARDLVDAEFMTQLIWRDVDSAEFGIATTIHRSRSLVVRGRRTVVSFPQDHVSRGLAS